MAGTQLAKLINKKMEDRGKEANKELQFSTPPPRPILPMNLGTSAISVTDYDPLEVIPSHLPSRLPLTPPLSLPPSFSHSPLLPRSLSQLPPYKATRAILTCSLSLFL